MAAVATTGQPAPVAPVNGNGSVEETFDPFPDFKYSGKLRAAYPLAPMSQVPSHIVKPNYAREEVSSWKSLLSAEGIKLRWRMWGEFFSSKNIKINDKQEQDGVRKAAILARQVLDTVASHIRPGITTDQLDKVCFDEAIKRDCYPSPLNYHGYPKSICTSVNEVICHGIPDRTVLQDGDIINLDVTLYHKGFHGDLNATYTVGPKAEENEDAVKLMKTARTCLDAAIALCGPGIPFGAIGHVIQPLAEARGCAVVKRYTGHGIGRTFHSAPTIFHHKTKKAWGVMQPGMIFTIEPMLILGDKWQDLSWPDDWTVTSVDGSWSAAAEETMLITETGVEVLTAQGGPKAYDTTKRRQLWAQQEQKKSSA